MLDFLGVLLDNGEMKQANDNFFGRKHWYTSPECLRFLQHIPVAQMLIKKHFRTYWKNLPNDTAYLEREFHISWAIENMHQGSPLLEMTLNGLAQYLGTTTIELCNDPDLPFGQMAAEHQIPYEG
jgi:hypothetical protein